MDTNQLQNLNESVRQVIHEAGIKRLGRVHKSLEKQRARVDKATEREAKLLGGSEMSGHGARVNIGQRAGKLAKQIAKKQASRKKRGAAPSEKLVKAKASAEKMERIGKRIMKSPITRPTDLDIDAGILSGRGGRDRDARMAKLATKQ